ncbi:MAG: DUF5676 family membrane protein [bacterium]|nr:DUF5676 family membrane protein [bacterium]
MLKEKAFANSLAVLTGLLYIALAVLKMVVPSLFTFIFNAQFFGADVATLVPTQSLGDFSAILVAVLITAWIAGYLWAWFYNKFNK